MQKPSHPDPYWAARMDERQYKDTETDYMINGGSIERRITILSAGDWTTYLKVSDRDDINCLGLPDTDHVVLAGRMESRLNGLYAVFGRTDQLGDFIGVSTTVKVSEDSDVIDINAIKRLMSQAINENPGLRVRVLSRDIDDETASAWTARAKLFDDKDAEQRLESEGRERIKRWRTGTTI